jgi:DNA-binding transcriptional LysR family regulator
MQVLREVSWDWVKAFVVVVEQGSLARAATQLGITGATLSRQMSALEARLGYRLFLRTRSGMAPTPEAQSLLEPAQHMLAAMHRFGLSHAQSDTAVSGVVAISAPQTFALHVLPELLAPLRALHPQIQLDVWALDAVSNLHQRDADIAIRMVRPTQAGLIAKRVAQFSIGLYASQSYLARRGQPNRTNLQQHDWIDVMPQETMRQGLVRMGLPAVAERIMLRANSYAGSWALVE